MDRYATTVGCFSSGKSLLFLSRVLVLLGAGVACCNAYAQTPEGNADAAKPSPAAVDGNIATVIISSEGTRSSLAMGGKEIQKILPGTNPVKALQSLPG